MSEDSLQNESSSGKVGNLNLTEPGTAPAAAPQPGASPSTAPKLANGAGKVGELTLSDESDKGSLLGKLNPARLFARDTPSRLVKQGRDAMENRNFAQATVAFNKALEMDADYAPAMKGLGDVMMKKGGRSNVTAAIEHFREAALREPLDEHNYAMMAKCYDALNMRKEAALEKKKLVVVKTLEREPDNPAANNNMGILYLQQKRVQEAIQYFNKAVEADPGYDTALRNLAVTYYRLATDTDDRAKAESFLEKAKPFIAKAMEITNSPLSLLTHARILMYEENWEDALAVCQAAEAIDPGLKDVFGLKHTVLMKLNRLEEANAAYETYRFLNAHD